MNILFSIIILPIVSAAVIFAIPRRFNFLKNILGAAVSVINLAAAIYLCGKNIYVSIPWAGFGFDIALKTYHFSSIAILAAAFFGAFSKKKP